jgi:hypothetical protein
VQDRKKRRVDDEGLGVADQLGQDGTAQGLQETPQLPHPAVQRGGVHPRHSREKVREEPLGVAQEGSLALDAPQLLEERQRQDLGVREPLERLVGSTVGVEQRVGVVHEAEQDRDRLFQGGERRGMLRIGHPRFLSPGIRMASVLLPNHATLI